MDHYERVIYSYVDDNPGVTENMVRKSGIVSSLTGRRKVQKLIERGILEDRRVGNSFHKLYVANKNEFHRISKKLSEIESLTDKIGGQIDSIYQQRRNEYTQSEYAYFESVRIMLELLLVRINKKIRSRSDSQVLYNRIVRTMVKTTEQCYDMKDPVDLLNTIVDQFLKPSKMMTPKLIDVLKNNVHSFQKEFLSQS